MTAYRVVDPRSGTLLFLSSYRHRAFRVAYEEADRLGCEILIEGPDGDCVIGPAHYET